MKKLFSFYLLCFFITSPGLPGIAEAASLSLTAPSVVLLDAQNQRVIFSRSPNTKRAPASTTKLLTVMVVLDNLSLDQIVRIPGGLEYVQPSKIGLRQGEQFYVRDLVKAALIKSANDAAEALAIITAGSKSAFAGLMNQKIRTIGADRSHFVNPSGLPAENQYSTAYDLAKIIMAATRHPYIVQVLKTRDAVIYSRGGRRIYLKNCNKMLWRTDAVIGKTGWTRNARHCFAGRVQVNGKSVFVGIMGSPKRQYLWSDLSQIVAYSGGKAVPSGKEKTSPILFSHEETKKIQAALKKTGYFTGSPTGFYGKRTKRAVRQFQKASGLPVTGIVGTATWNKLKAY